MHSLRQTAPERAGIYQPEGPVTRRCGVCPKPKCFLTPSPHTIPFLSGAVSTNCLAQMRHGMVRGPCAPVTNP